MRDLLTQLPRLGPHVRERLHQVLVGLHVPFQAVRERLLRRVFGGTQLLLQLLLRLRAVVRLVFFLALRLRGLQQVLQLAELLLTLLQDEPQGLLQELTAAIRIRMQ